MTEYSSRPPIGWTVDVEYIKNYDGDTATFKVSREITLRVQSSKGLAEGYFFDTPEIRSKSVEDKELAQKYKKMMHDICTNAKELVVHIPGSEKVQDVLCIGGRVVGLLYADGKNVADLIEASLEEENSKKEN